MLVSIGTVREKRQRKKERESERGGKEREGISKQASCVQWIKIPLSSISHNTPHFHITIDCVRVQGNFNLIRKIQFESNVNV